MKSADIPNTERKAFEQYVLAHHESYPRIGSYSRSVVDMGLHDMTPENIRICYDFGLASSLGCWSLSSGQAMGVNF
jgi:hypothetical protein